MYRWAIEGAHRHGRRIGICGQAPSDRPDIARALVGLGIDSLSVSPDRLIATRRAVAQIEQSLPRPHIPDTPQAPRPASTAEGPQGRRAKVTATATAPSATNSAALQNS
jgi:hypothetical protein